MKFVNLHTHHFKNNPDVFEIVNQYPKDFNTDIPFYSIGIHPWYIDETRISEDLAIIESKLESQNCLAIGECGLDKRIEISFELQMEVFERQLALAERHQKPVIIHCVAAFSEVIAIKKRLKISVPMIIHGFSKNIQTAKQLLDNGFYLSFGKYLLRNPELKSVFQSVPDNRFFLETDTIEEGIQQVYDVASRYKNMDLQSLHKVISDNCNCVFGKVILNNE